MVETLKIPVLFEHLTPEWLTAALRERGHLATGRVVGVQTERFGEGVDAGAAVAHAATCLYSRVHDPHQPVTGSSRATNPACCGQNSGSRFARRCRS